ncbi:hypothetical protein HOU02_gp214 [Caulobacter phage CcrBL9]|uniref:Uncharacterized protein n=1 Tax=Caulobacter phage CcrBL9 TaxID=2283270 RepID=A0A385ECA3_9CAUD|nr:hypothetical protein HOU02_gp214 [Caulobacter phage CcrBL9]AXQ69511.1 hypothetical protein CcrBL9_gp487 [Caulobacter phage CcrBL9]
MLQMVKLDPRIGVLQTERGMAFYAYPNGYDAPAVRGSREKVEYALGVRRRFNALGDVPFGPYLTVYDVEVTVRSWSHGYLRFTREPIRFEGIRAPSKSAANQEARRLLKHGRGGLPSCKATLRENG